MRRGDGRIIVFGGEWRGYVPVEKRKGVVGCEGDYGIGCDYGVGGKRGCVVQNERRHGLGKVWLGLGTVKGECR